MNRERIDLRGRDADKVSDIPKPGWRDIALRIRDEAKDDNLSLLSAGVAFFAMLSLVPALVAVVSLYGLVADPADIEQQARDMTRALPREARDLLIQQLNAIVDSSDRGLGFAFIGGLVLTLWSASSAMKHLIEAVNTTYDEKDERGFVKVRGLALLMAVIATAFVVGAVWVIAVVPRTLGDSSLGDGAEFVLKLLRWPLLFVAMVAALALIYKVGPDRDRPKFRWVSWGAVLAAVLWVVVSIAFAIYTANFGKYNETYGALGAVIVMMLWLYMTAFVVLLGSEINAEIEHQTAKDTTIGPDRPMGARGGRMADEIGVSPSR